MNKQQYRVQAVLLAAHTGTNEEYRYSPIWCATSIGAAIQERRLLRSFPPGYVRVENIRMPND